MDTLPTEILCDILSYIINVQSLVNCLLVCKLWRDVIRYINLYYFNNFHKLCRREHYGVIMRNVYMHKDIKSIITGIKYYNLGSYYQHIDTFARLFLVMTPYEPLTRAKSMIINMIASDIKEVEDYTDIICNWDEIRIITGKTTAYISNSVSVYRFGGYNNMGILERTFSSTADWIRRDNLVQSVLPIYKRYY